jgi:hypothetical protein
MARIGSLEATRTGGFDTSLVPAVGFTVAFVVDYQVPRVTHRAFVSNESSYFAVSSIVCLNSWSSAPFIFT